MKTTTPSQSSRRRQTSSRPDDAGPGKPFTVDHFRRWTSLLRLDNGERWELADYQVEAAADIFRGARELWLVIPEGNGKTTFLAGLALYHIRFRYRGYVPVAASSRDQAKELYQQAEVFVTETPHLDKYFRCYDGYRRIKCKQMKSQVQIFAADEGTGDGIIPTMPLVDELHRHKDLALWRLWRGKLLKRGGQIVGISTAGDPDSEFEQTRQKMLKNAEDRKVNGAHTRVASGGMVLHDYAVPADRSCDDLKWVKKANPLPSITIAALKEKKASPTMTNAHWMRLVCNRATRIEGGAIDEEEFDSWGRDYGDLPPGEPVSIGIDLAWRWDDSAVVPVSTANPEEWRIGKPIIMQSPRNGKSRSDKKLKAALVRLNKRNPVEMVVMDPNAGGESLAQWIEEKWGIEPVAHGQGLAPRSLAAERILERFRIGGLVHQGDPDFKRHCLNAGERILDNGRIVFTRTSESRDPSKQDQRVYDALDAASFVVSTLVAELDEDDPWDYKQNKFEVLG